MNAVKNAKRVISKKYGFMRMPSILSPEFVSLIRGTRQLADLTVDLENPRKKIRSMSVTFDADSTAGTNQHNDVKIPAWYCHQDTLEKFIGQPLTQEEATMAALMMVNGSSIHEALHVAHSGHLWSPPTQNAIKAHENEGLFTNLLQLTEDLKNEMIITERDELNEYVVGKNQLMFTESRFEKVVAEAMKKYGKDDLRSIATETLPFYKCEDRRETIEAMFKAAGLDAICPILQESVSATIDPVSQADKLYELLKDTNAAAHSQSISDSQMEAAMKQAKKAAERGDGLPMEVKMEENTPGQVPPLEEVDVLSNPYREGGAWNYDPESKHKDFSYIKKLKISRQIIPYYAEPRKSGTTLVKTRLSRIVTDGKMFSRRGESVASISKKQPEYIILTDMSGSMHWMIGMVMKVTRMMSEEMRDCGIPHAVYGHTSHGARSAGSAIDVPVLYHIYSYQVNGRTDAKQDSRFDQAQGIDLTENYDGMAISAVSKKFTRTAQNKILLVLSDGKPIGIHYERPVEHTIDAVKDARKRGIKVISLSLVSSVIEDNNKIYGAENNIDATTPAKLEAGLQRLVLGG